MGTGSIEAVFEIGLDNGFNMTDAIPNGTEIEINLEPFDSIVHRYYQTKKVKPATGRLAIFNLTQGAFSGGFSNAFEI